MIWNKSESTVYPILVEENCGLFYIRKNITEDIREDTTFYIYDECITDAGGLVEYLSERELENKTNIEYIAMVTGVELGE